MRESGIGVVNKEKMKYSLLLNNVMIIILLYHYNYHYIVEIIVFIIFTLQLKRDELKYMNLLP